MRVNAVRLALRVLVADRRALVATLLTALGVAATTALITLLVTLPSAALDRSARASWQHPADDGARPARALVLTTPDVVGDRAITRIDVAPARGDISPDTIPVPPGVPRFPEPGEVLMSSALAELAADLPYQDLAVRFDGEVVGTVEEAALAHPDQLLALVGHEPGTLPAFSAAVPGLAVHGGEPDLPLLAVAGLGVVALGVPCLVLIASAARLAAARRPRRLAAFRLSGATPWQVTAMAATGAAVAGVLGTAAGLVAGAPLRALVALVPWRDGPWSPDDLAPPGPMTLLVAVLVPLGVVTASVVGTRRAARSPWGSAGERRWERPSPWRWVAPVLALAVLLWGVNASGEHALPLAVLGLVAFPLSVSLVGPSLAAALGGAFARLWRGPAALLAGRRLLADPVGAYRAGAGLVLTVFLASTTLTLLSNPPGPTSGERPVADSVLTVDLPSTRAVPIADAVRTGLDERGIEATVAVAGLATVAGHGLARWDALVLPCAEAVPFGRVSSGDCAGSPAVLLAGGGAADVRPRVVRHSAGGGHLAGDQLALAGADHLVRRVERDGAPPAEGWALVDPSALADPGALTEAAVLVTTTSGTREATRGVLGGAAPGLAVDSGAQRRAVADQLHEELRWAAALGLLGAGLLAGCGAALSAAGSITDRRRTIGALVAAGASVRALGRASRLEAAVPRLVASLVASGAGFLVGAAVLSRWDLAPSPNGWLVLPVAVGSLAAVVAAATAGPALRSASREPLAGR
ncbi:hypothetical protein C1701_11460 [Actinoalloteichus sp. AHMU CJ021]|uniref:FtsX-like permease family protein n=1 Tax=Actinoalloteichus sp. AHMU CJ021 TaxID=2072503 RepID=UPI000CA02E81|nr:hypothetical protein C1701_11460 [Actinoalloteichus sp. AHMU CJ021]